MAKTLTQIVLDTIIDRRIIISQSQISVKGQDHHLYTIQAQATFRRYEEKSFVTINDAVRYLSENYGIRINNYRLVYNTDKLRKQAFGLRIENMKKGVRYHLA